MLNLNLMLLLQPVYFRECTFIILNKRINYKTCILMKIVEKGYKK